MTLYEFSEWTNLEPSSLRRSPNKKKRSVNRLRLQILQRSNKYSIPKSRSFPRCSQLAMQLNLPHQQHLRTSSEIYSSTRRHQPSIILQPHLTTISYLKANHGKDSYPPLMLFHKLRS
jgi:hypothetical protein